METGARCGNVRRTNLERLTSESGQNPKPPFSAYVSSGQLRTSRPVRQCRRSAFTDLSRCSNWCALGVDYSTTSSAMESTSGGTSMFRARAVCRLMTNSNLLDCRTGSSAGFSPLSILPA